MNNPQLVVRIGQDRDAAALAAFNQAMARETEGKQLDPGVLEKGVQAVLGNPDRGFYAVALQNEALCACLMVTREWSDWRNGYFWWIQSVYVPPEHRRRGLYRRLYQFVRQQAEQAEDVVGFRLYVERENHVAQTTYQSLGMQPTHYIMYEQLR